jgi:Bacterial toxin 23
LKKAYICKYTPSAGNYAHDSDDTQGHNRYSYALNNPLKYTDPTGNFVTGIELVSNIVGPVFNLMQGNYKGNFGKFAMDLGIGIVNGAISEVNPLDWNMGKGIRLGISVNLFSGTDGIGIGVEAGASIGFGNWRVADIYAGIRSTTSAYGTNDLALESYVGFGLGLYYQKDDINGIKKGFALKNTWFFSTNGTNQAVGGISFYFKGLNRKQGSLNYENDWLFGIAGDSGDRYRTAAVGLETGGFELGFNLFTGQPKVGINGKRQTDPGVGTEGTYQESGTQYREGIFYIGAGGYRVGINEEGVRNLFQNKLAHGNGNIFPIFQVIDKQPNLYFNYYKNKSRYTLW